MANINSILLSTFSPINPAHSSQSRFHTLLLIYVNLTLFLLLTVHEFVASFFFHHDVIMWVLLMISLIAAGLSSLRKGRNGLATTILVVEIHTINFIASSYYNTPLLSYYILALFPTLMILLPLTHIQRLLHTILTAFQGTFYLLEVGKIFQITLAIEQSQQIYTLTAFSFISILFLLIICLFPSQIPEGTSLPKVSILGKESLHTMENHQMDEETAVGLMFQTTIIKTQLITMNEKIEHLMNKSRELGRPLKLLRELKPTLESLINSVNRSIDAFNLRYNRLELNLIPTVFEEIIKKTLSITSEDLKSHDVYIQASLDKNLPESLMIDQTRYVEILVELIRNSVKFSPKESTVDLYATWCSQGFDKAHLLTPIVKRVIGLGVSRDTSEETSVESAQRLRLLRNESTIFREFTSEEAEKRMKNFKSLKSLHHRTFKGVEEDFSENETAEHEPWSIRKTGIVGESQSGARHGSWPSYQQEDRNSRKTKGYIKVQISDKGCGMNEEEMLRVLGVFELEKSNCNVENKNGKGLWLCKQLCEKMEGGMKVYSKEKRGTTFVFYVPVNNSHLAMVKTPSDKSKENIKTKKKNTVNAMVVDDYESNRELHKLILEQEGVYVTLACDGSEAVKIYKEREGKGENPFDFIMMDVRMPIMDGITAAREIRKYEDEVSLEKVEILFVSGDYLHEKEVASQESKTKFLKKPVDIELLRQIIKGHRKKIEQSD